MPKWDEITRTEKYQNLPPEAQAQVKTEWFKANLLPEIENRPSLKEMGPDKVYEWFMQQPDDTGQGYVTSLLGSAARGFGEVVPGAVEGVGAITGIEGLREAGRGIRSGLESITPVNPLYQQEVPMQLAGVGGQIGSVLATGGVGGALGKALGGVNAVSRGAQGALLGSAFLQGAAEGRREAEQYGMEGPEAYLRGLTGGAIEAGTEFLPFGMAAETALAKRMLAGAPKTSSFLGAAGSEFGEEGLGKIASNIATQTLAPAGVETPGIMEGALENALYGAAGGAMLGGINALIPSAPKSPEIQIATEALNATTDTPFTDISGQAAADTIAQNTELAMRMPVQPVEAAEEIAPKVTPSLETEMHSPPQGVALSKVEAINKTKADLDERAKALGYDNARQLNMALQTQSALSDEQRQVLEGYGLLGQEIRALSWEDASDLSDGDFSTWAKSRFPAENPRMEEELRDAADLHRALTKRGDTQKAEQIREKIKNAKRRQDWTFESWNKQFPDEPRTQEEIDAINAENAAWNAEVDVILESFETSEMPEKSSQTITGSNGEIAPEMPVPVESTVTSPGEAPPKPDNSADRPVAPKKGDLVTVALGGREYPKTRIINVVNTLEGVRYQVDVFGSKFVPESSIVAIEKPVVKDATKIAATPQIVRQLGDIAVKNKQPLDQGYIDSIGGNIPQGYVKQGDLYVFQPEAPAGPLRISIPEGATSSRTDNVKYQVAGLPDEVVDPFLAHGTDSADAVEALVKSGPRKDTEHYEGRLVPKDDGSPWGNTKTSASFVIISKPGQTTSSPNEIGAVVVNRTSRGDEKTASMIAGMERRLDGTGVAVLTPEELPNWLRRTVSQTTAAETQTSGVATERDLTKPKPLTDKELPSLDQRGITESGREIEARFSPTERMEPLSTPDEQRNLREAQSGLAYGKAVRGEPLTQREVDSLPVRLPEGYVKQGELYVFQPQTTKAAAETDIETGAPKLDSKNDYFASNLASRAWRIAAGMQWDDNAGDWVHPNYPGRSRSVVESEITESNPPSKADVQRVFNELAKSYGREDLIKGEKTTKLDAKDFIQVGRFVKVGYRVPIYEKGEVVGGKTNKVVGKITRIMPDGKVEVRLNQGGFKVLPPSEIEDAPTHVGNKPLSTQTTAAEKKPSPQPSATQHAAEIVPARSMEVSEVVNSEELAIDTNVAPFALKEWQPWKDAAGDFWVSKILTGDVVIRKNNGRFYVKGVYGAPSKGFSTLPEAQVWTKEQINSGRHYIPQDGPVYNALRLFNVGARRSESIIITRNRLKGESGMHVVKPDDIQFTDRQEILPPYSDYTLREILVASQDGRTAKSFVSSEREVGNFPSVDISGQGDKIKHVITIDDNHIGGGRRGLTITVYSPSTASIENGGTRQVHLLKPPTAAETQTPESVAVDSGAAGVVQSEPSRGSILEVEKESTKTAIESTGKSAPSEYGEVVNSARKSLKERPADFKAQEQVLSDLMKLPVADLQSAFEVVTGSPTKLTNKTQLANNVLNALLAEAQESKPTAAEDTFRKAEREAEEEIQRQNAQSISNLFDKLRTNPQAGQVTRADVNQAIGALQNSGEVPNAIFTWNGTTDDLLRQRATMERQFPGAVAAASMPNVEGVFENGMAFVFSDRVVVTDLDRRKAAEEGISPSVAAVKRVVTHENMHKGLWLLSPKQRSDIMSFLRQMFPAAELDELAKSYRQYADWRTNPVHEMALLDERLQKYIEETKTIPTDGVWKQFWDYIKEIWRKLTGKPNGEPTLQSMKDVVRLLRSALKNAHRARPDRTIDGGRVLMSVSGGRSFVPAVNIDGRVEIGASHYDAWIKHALRQIPNFKKDGLSDEERRQLADRWIVDHPEFMAYSLRKEGFVSDGEFLNRQDSLKKFKSLGGVQQMAPGEPDRDWLDASDVEGYRFSYASEQDEASSIGQQTARYAASSPRTIEAIVGVRQAYASMPKSNGAAVMLDDLFAETVKLVPNLIRPEFDRVVQGMYDDNAALLNDAQNPSSVTILPGAMMSMAGGANDAEYFAAVEAGDMEKAQRMVDEADAARLTSAQNKRAKILKNLSPESLKDTVDGAVERDSAVRALLDTFTVPIGFTLEGAGASGGGSIYIMARDVIERNADGEPLEVEDFKLSIRNHDPSPFREKEFGKVDKYEEVEDPRNPIEVAAAITKLEQWLDKKGYKNDAVTHDDAGNVIPPSKRFQPTSPDIRFSIASTPEQQSAAAKFKSAITAAAKGLPDLREYEGRLVKAASGEALDVEPHNVLWFDGFMKASDQLLSDLQKQGLSLQQIYDKVAMDTEFKRELGLFDEETGSGQAATVLSGLLLQRTLNAARKARTAEAKAQGDALHRKAAAYYSALATARGQNLLMYRLLQNDPRTRFAFMEDRVTREMLKKAEHGVNVQFGDGYAATQEAVNDAVDASAEAAKTEVADAVENAAEEDQDAIDLAEGEATLDAKGKTLWEKFKDLIRKRGIAARALNAIRSAKNARQSIAKSERDSISQMSEEELVKFIAGLDSEMETVFGQFVGGSDETTRKKREKMVKTAQKRAKKGQDIDIKPTDVSKIINQVRRDIKTASGKPIQWREIFRQPGKTVEEYRQNIFNAVNSNEAFKDLDEAQKRRLSELFAEAWQAQRDKILKSMIEQHTYSLERQQKKEAAKALRDARNQIIEAVNLGAFSNDELTRVLGEKFGFKTSFTEDEKQKLSELAEKLQDEKLNKAKRNKLAREFLSTLQSGTQIPIAELLSNWWVSAVLSGGNTVSAIALSFLNGTGIGIMGTHLSRALRELMKGNTANAIDAITSLFKAYAKHISSFPTAANRAWQYLWSGDVSFLESAANDPFGRVNTLADIAKYQVVADQVAKDPNKVKAVMGRFMQFMGRLLTALDAFNVMATKAGTISLAIRQSGLTPEQIRDAELKSDLKFYKDKIVREDPHFGGKQPTSAKEKAYLSSLAEAEMYADLAEMGVKMENADYLASESAMTMNPTGFGGIVYNSIKALDTKVTSETEKHLDMAQVAWAKSKNAEDAIKLFTWSLVHFFAKQGLNVFGLRFARFAGNKFNQSLSFVPGLGLLRMIEADNKELAGRQEAFKDTIIRNQTLGWIIMFAGWAIIKAIEEEPDDEKRGWFINGGWNNLTPDQKKQKISRGEKQYTIGTGDYVFSYQNWPISQPLAALGALSDLVRFSQDKWKEKTTGGKAGSAVISGMQAALEIPALTQVNEIFANTMASKDPAEQTASRLSRVTAGWMGGFMPRILKDLDYIQDPTMRRYETLFQKAASHVPVYRRYVGSDYYDILGNKIEKNAIPGSRDFMKLEDKPEYRMLGALNARGIWLTPANAEYRMVGKGRFRRRLTQEEADRYSLETGKLYRQMVMNYGPRALQMPVERAKDYISAKADDMRDLALQRAVRN